MSKTWMGEEGVPHIQPNPPSIGSIRLYRCLAEEMNKWLSDSRYNKSYVSPVFGSLDDQKMAAIQSDKDAFSLRWGQLDDNDFNKTMDTELLRQSAEFNYLVWVWIANFKERLRLHPSITEKVNKEAREHIMQKIPESNLMQTANNGALEAISLMENLVETIGWTLDYSALELPEYNQNLLEK